MVNRDVKKSHNTNREKQLLQTQDPIIVLYFIVTNKNIRIVKFHKTHNKFP